jgi:hypothetical protein
MARGTYEKYKVQFVPTIASATLAPTVAEFNAGTVLTTFTPVDGVNFSPTQNNATQAMLGDAFVTEEPGTWGLGLTLTFVRDDTTDTPVTTFPYNTAGYIVMNPFGVTIAAGAKVDVYKGKSHNPVPLASAENEYQKWQVVWAVTATPKFGIAVLA